MDGEVSLQRMQLQYRVLTYLLLLLNPFSLSVYWCFVWYLSLRLQHETELLEDSYAQHGFQPATTSYKYGSSDEELMDSDDYTSTHVRTRPPIIPNSRFTNGSQPRGIKQEVRRRHSSHHNWLHKLVKNLPFTTPPICLFAIIWSLKQATVLVFCL